MRSVSYLLMKGWGEGDGHYEGLFFYSGLVIYQVVYHWSTHSVCCKKNTTDQSDRSDPNKRTGPNIYMFEPV